MTSGSQDVKAIGQFIFGNTVVILFPDDYDGSISEHRNAELRKILIRSYGAERPEDEDTFDLPGLDVTDLIFILEDVMNVRNWTQTGYLITSIFGQKSGTM